MAQRRRYLFVCTNRREPGTPKGSCATRGSERIHLKLKAAVAARGLAQTEIRVCSASCTDVCWAGPVVAVMPDNYFYGRVQESDIGDIVDALATGNRLERLVLPKEDFEMQTAGAMLAEFEGEAI